MRLFLILVVFLAGCAEMVETTVKDVPFVGKAYPVSDEYGRQTLPVFAQRMCGGILDQACERQYIGYFGQKLLEHYRQTPHALTVCQANIVLCMNDHVFEDHVRFWGQI